MDGRSFYFRERHGHWRIEVDLEPDGRYAHRIVGTGADGELITEAVELTLGTVIAEGVESTYGPSPVAHLAFIVATIRDQLAVECGSHAGAGRFCPSCGERRLVEETP